MVYPITQLIITSDLLGPFQHFTFSTDKIRACTLNVH